MAASQWNTLLSPSMEEHISVKADRRFAVFSRGLLESLRGRYSADFAVLIHLGSRNGNGSVTSEVISQNGAVPKDFETEILNLLSRDDNFPSDDFNWVINSAEECISHRFSVTTSDSLIFILGYRSASTDHAESVDSFVDSLNKIQSEVSDVFLISQQAKKIEELRSRLEQTEEVLDSSKLYLFKEVENQESTNRSEVIFDVKTSSSRMKSVLDQVSKVGKSDLSLLIRGEVGTGKAYLARKVHEHSKEMDSPFEMISCGALTPSLVEGELFGWKKGAFSGADEDRSGLFERANGGTVFLDEVSELPPEIQQKLLRVIQENEVRPIGSSDPVRVKCRIISSSCKDLVELVDQGKFREDLYYRLSGFQFEVPPLRERGEDLDLLVSGFLRDLREEHGLTKKFSESAAMELRGFAWPGNIQQLKNVIQQAYLISDKRIIARKVVLSVIQESTADALLGQKFEVTPEEICIRIPRTEGFNEIIFEVERAVILAAMQQSRGNKSRVTKQLKIPRQTLYNKLERFDFTDEDVKC